MATGGNLLVFGQHLRLDFFKPDGLDLFNAFDGSLWALINGTIYLRFVEIAQLQDDWQPTVCRSRLRVAALFSVLRNVDHGISLRHHQWAQLMYVSAFTLVG